MHSKHHKKLRRLGACHLKELESVNCFFLPLMVHGNSSQRQKIDTNDLCFIGRGLVVCLGLMT